MKQEELKAKLQKVLIHKMMKLTDIIKNKLDDKTERIVLEINNEDSNNSKEIISNLIKDIDVHTGYKVETITDGQKYHMIINKSENNGENYA